MVVAVVSLDGDENMGVCGTLGWLLIHKLYNVITLLAMLRQGGVTGLLDQRTTPS